MVDETVLQAVLEAALRSGASFSEVFVERRRTQNLRLEERRLESVSSGVDVGAGVRVIAGGRTGYCLTNIVDEHGLMEAAEAAAATARGSSKDQTVDLRERKPGARHVVEEDPFEVSSHEKADWLWEVDDAARGGGPEVAQVAAGLLQACQEVTVANSLGSLARDVRTRVSLSVMVVAQRNGNLQRAFDAYAAGSGLELLRKNSVAELASTVASSAISKLDAIPCPAGEMPVVIGARSGGVLFHEACGHPCEADNIVKGASVYLGLEGKKVAEAFVTIVDDATMPNGWGSFAFDDEGTPASKTYLVSEGILSSYLVDLSEGFKLGRPSTGNGRRESYEHIPIPRMTNTYLQPGSTDPAEIIRDTDRGVWIGRLGGGQVNPATGAFVFGADEAFLIEKGELTSPVRGATLIGDGPTVLSRIDAVGSDFGTVPGTCGKFGQNAHAGIGQPTLRVSKLTVGGTG